MLLVGNKADLEAERQVSAGDAKELARKLGVRFDSAAAAVVVVVALDIEFLCNHSRVMIGSIL